MMTATREDCHDDGDEGGLSISICLPRTLVLRLTGFDRGWIRTPPSKLPGGTLRGGFESTPYQIP